MQWSTWDGAGQVTRSAGQDNRPYLLSSVWPSSYDMPFHVLHTRTMNILNSLTSWTALNIPRFQVSLKGLYYSGSRQLVQRFYAYTMKGVHVGEYDANKVMICKCFHTSGAQKRTQFQVSAVTASNNRGLQYKHTSIFRDMDSFLRTVHLANKLPLLPMENRPGHSIWNTAYKPTVINMAAVHL
jgi:hypothetical protein